VARFLRLEMQATCQAAEARISPETALPRRGRGQFLPAESPGNWPQTSVHNTLGTGPEDEGFTLAQTLHWPIPFNTEGSI
jgi:hypothetical protein